MGDYQDQRDRSRLRARLLIENYGRERAIQRLLGQLDETLFQLFKLNGGVVKGAIAIAVDNTKQAPVELPCDVSDISA